MQHHCAVSIDRGESFFISQIANIGWCCAMQWRRRGEREKGFKNGNTKVIKQRAHSITNHNVGFSP